MPVHDSFGSSPRPVGIASAVQRFRVRLQLLFVSFASTFSWPSLAASTSCSYHAAINFCLSFVTVYPHLCLRRRCFPVPRYAERLDAALYAIGPLFFPPTRPLCIASSTFPITNRFGSLPPLIRMSVPAHESLFVRKVVSMFSHRIIPSARS